MAYISLVKKFKNSSSQLSFRQSDIILNVTCKYTISLAYQDDTYVYKHYIHKCNFSFVFKFFNTRRNTSQK